jgi:dihydrofolate reductase
MDEIKIKLIAALSKNNVIGIGNSLPWRLPDDMKYFAEKTTNHTVIMGRKSWDSIPAKFKPLPNRRNVVLTKQNIKIEGCEVQHSFNDAMEDLLLGTKKGEDIFIIGGAEIYKIALPYADELLLTEIDAEVAGDVYFPEYDKSKFKEVSRIHHPADEKHKFAFDFVTYEKIEI